MPVFFFLVHARTLVFFFLEHGLEFWGVSDHDQVKVHSFRALQQRHRACMHASVLLPCACSHASFLLP